MKKPIRITVKELVNSGAETDFLAFLCAEFATDPIPVVTIPNCSSIGSIGVSIIADFTYSLFLKSKFMLDYNIFVVFK